MSRSVSGVRSSHADSRILPEAKNVIQNAAALGLGGMGGKNRLDVH